MSRPVRRLLDHLFHGLLDNATNGFNGAPEICSSINHSLPASLVCFAAKRETALKPKPALRRSRLCIVEDKICAKTSRSQLLRLPILNGFHEYSFNRKTRI
jgi:hypothetical protein